MFSLLKKNKNILWKFYNGAKTSNSAVTTYTKLEWLEHLSETFS